LSGLAIALCAVVCVPASAGRQARTSAIRTPHLNVLHRSSRDASGFVFIAPKEGSGRHGPEIVDDRGRPVWFHPVPDAASDFRVQRYQGSPVLTWSQGIVPESVEVIEDSAYHVVATVRAGNGLQVDMHEFLLTPQGTALVTISHPVPYDLSSLGGPKDGMVIDGVVEEIEVATGRVLFEWHSLAHVPLDESHSPVPQDEPYDYFHLNAVNLDDDGNLLISGRHTWTVYKVDRHTGQILWRLGGKHSDFTLGPGVAFAWQHNPLPAGTGTLRIFDNENNGEPGGRVMAQSRVIWVHLNTATMNATLVKEITHPGGLSVPSQGNAQALDNGDTFVGWGQLGRVSEFDPAGKLIFDATLGGGNNTYRGYRFQWNGRPETRPTASARYKGHRKTVVEAVWNGATAVARWRILAGRGAKRLRPVRTVRWSGLDTTAVIRGRPREIEVVALDAQGSVLATSKPVRPRT
jgi:arylsulfotransferase ASST